MRDATLRRRAGLKKISRLTREWVHKQCTTMVQCTKSVHGRLCCRRSES